jgi:hypothetical protein
LVFVDLSIKDVYGKKTAGLFKAVEAYFLANPDA